MLSSRTVSASSLWRPVWLWSPPLVYAAAIFYLSAQSNPFPGVTAVVWDKALHGTEYAALAALLVRALRGEGLRGAVAAGCAVVLSVGYGVSDEWHQSFVPGRSSDIHDCIADGVGALLGAGGVVWAQIAVGSRQARRRLRGSSV